MGCNDSVLDNGGIPACLRDYSLYGSTYTGCGGQADKMPSAGCVWLDGDRAGFTAAEICYYYGGQLLMPANDSDTCLSIGRCQEPDFAPGSFPPVEFSTAAFFMSYSPLNRGYHAKERG